MSISRHAAGWFVMSLLALGVAIYALGSYGFLPLGAAVHPALRANFAAHALGLYLHVFGACFALALGPFQFLPSLRARLPAVHRWLGLLYLSMGVLVGGLAGLYMSQFAFGGTPARLGFGVLALAWLYTGSRAYDAIRRREIAEHRRWMIRNFALAFAAVTLRLYVPAAVVSGIEFATAYAVIAWACWVPNLLAAEWWVRASVPPAPASPRGP